MTTQHISPGNGIRALTENWKYDLIAAVSVALVALPLGLGIAIASGAPALSGLVSIVVGGFVTTFIRGGHVSINGPANSLIVVTVAAAGMLAEFGGNTFAYIMAAFVISGALQVAYGVLRIGTWANFFPSSVVAGLLAAIGVIIVAKQAHVALGHKVPGGHTLEVIKLIPDSLMTANPYLIIVAVVSLGILFFHSKIAVKWIHMIPAAIWVLLFAVPAVMVFNYVEATYPAFGDEYYIAGADLVKIPDKMWTSLILPDWAILGELKFWLAVMVINIVTTIETLVSAKAVDKLDPYRRTTNLNQDLIGVGLGTIISGFLGGLPVITVVARSSVNVNHGARTRWSNLFQGLIILFILLALTGAIQYVPMSALAAILVYTGFKLFMPKVFEDAYVKGLEQFLILCVTLFSTLMTGLLAGIAIGVGFTLFLQLIKSNMAPSVFLGYIIKPSIFQSDDGISGTVFKVKGVLNFFNLLSFRRSLVRLPANGNIVVDFSHADLVDLTVLEFTHSYAETFNRGGGNMEITGLDVHSTSSEHPFALHILMRHRRSKPRLSRRQQELKKIAADNGWSFSAYANWNTSEIRYFPFFETRPVEYKNNIIRGHYHDNGISWEVSDITFDEGALLAAEEYHTTVQIVKLPFTIPEFTLQAEKFVDRLVDFASHQDIDFERFRDFSRKFLLRGRNRTEIENFFGEKLIYFLDKSEVYHLESIGNSICIFRYTRVATPKEMLDMLEFTNKLVGKLERRKEKTSDQNGTNGSTQTNNTPPTNGAIHKTSTEKNPATPPDKDVT